MHLNHPETIPTTLVRGKILFHETGPWCQNVGGHCCRGNLPDRSQVSGRGNLPDRSQVSERKEEQKPAAGWVGVELMEQWRIRPNISGPRSGAGGQQPIRGMQISETT